MFTNRIIKEPKIEKDNDHVFKVKTNKNLHFMILKFVKKTFMGNNTLIQKENIIKELLKRK